jgi:hypothetical protein
MKLGVYSTAAYLLIFVAAVAALVSFLGCCGAAKVSTKKFCSFVCSFFNSKIMSVGEILC